jgi:hypothetical protein
MLAITYSFPSLSFDYLFDQTNSWYLTLVSICVSNVDQTTNVNDLFW